MVDWYTKNGKFYNAGSGGEMSTDELKTYGVTDDDIAKAADRQGKIDKITNNYSVKDESGKGYKLSELGGDQRKKIAENVHGHLADVRENSEAANRLYNAANYDDILDKLAAVDPTDIIDKNSNTFRMYNAVGGGDLTKELTPQQQNELWKKTNQENWVKAGEAGDTDSMFSNPMGVNSMGKRFGDRVSATSNAFNRGDVAHGISGVVNSITGTTGDAITSAVKTLLSPLNFGISGLAQGIGSWLGHGEDAKNMANSIINGIEGFPGGIVSDVGNVWGDVTDAISGSDMTGNQLTAAERWGRAGDAALKTAMDASMLVNPAAAPALMAERMAAKGGLKAVEDLAASGAEKLLTKGGNKLLTSAEKDAAKLMEQKAASELPGASTTFFSPNKMGQVVRGTVDTSGGPIGALGNQIKTLKDLSLPHSVVQFNPKFATQAGLNAARAAKGAGIATMGVPMAIEGLNGFAGTNIPLGQSSDIEAINQASLPQAQAMIRELYKNNKEQMYKAIADKINGENKAEIAKNPEAALDAQAMLKNEDLNRMIGEPKAFTEDQNRALGIEGRTHEQMINEAVGNKPDIPTTVTEASIPLLAQFAALGLLGHGHGHIKPTTGVQ